LVVEPHGKWTRLIRNQLLKRVSHDAPPLDLPLDGISVIRCLGQSDLAREVFPSRNPSSTPELLRTSIVLPTAIVVEVTPENLLEWCRFFSHGRYCEQIAVWVIVPEELQPLDHPLQQLGFYGCLSHILDLERWAASVTRYFSQLPPVEPSLDLRIEQQYPWPPAPIGLE
jgi:hypothetical protein